MKELSHTRKNHTEHIQQFLNWIDSVEIRSTASKGRNTSFINGPYVDIKELIGKISSSPVEFRSVGCQDYKIPML